MELEKRIRRYLEGHDVLTLATVDEAGPWATPLFYVSDDSLDLFFLSDPSTRHCQAIARNPQVSAAVHGGFTAWTEIRGLQLEGQAHVVDDERAGASALARYATKFPFALALISPDRSHRFYRIRPRWLRLIDNSRGLGFKEELCRGKHAEVKVSRRAPG